jgi:NAD(P)-dependent dehydrogenase (short-subunit alcohol dehydrogenase family)
MTGFATYPSLRDRVAFVSGGASGLGAEFVAQLAAQGARAAFADVQDATGLARRWPRTATWSRSSSTATCATSTRYQDLAQVALRRI